MAIEGPTGCFTLRQMAAVAEFEAGLISSRTSVPLQVSKACGKKLGGDRGYELTDKADKLGSKAFTDRV
jgi:DNA invertase Pin-like site-specific DNA recombinase